MGRANRRIVVDRQPGAREDVRCQVGTLHPSFRLGGLMQLGLRLVVFVTCGLLAAAASVSADDAPQPDLKPLLAEVRKLVEKHYPKAEVTLKGQAIHLESDTGKYMIHEPLLTGEWQDAHEEVGPQKGGVHGDLELVPGQYGGMAAVPQSVDKRYFVLFVTAAYSKKLDGH